MAALALAGCVDSARCKLPSDWQPCAGAAAQPGASGTPPTILRLSLPTCAFVASPTVSGTLEVSDPDGDAQTFKATFSVGVRTDESEVQLPDVGRSGNDWSGSAQLTVMPAGGGAAGEGSYDVRAKVTDRAGGQSAPRCGTLTLLR